MILYLDISNFVTLWSEDILVFYFRIYGIRVIGDQLSPVKHVQLAEINDSRELDVKTLQRITDNVS